MSGDHRNLPSLTRVWVSRLTSGNLWIIVLPHSSSLTSNPSAVVDLGGGSVQLDAAQVTPSDRNKFTDYLRPTYPIGAAAPPTSSEKRMKDYFLASAASIRPQSMADGPLY
ncbi:hypothetical protein FOZ63_020632, partial [Perkinsus olseni]